MFPSLEQLGYLTRQFSSQPRTWVAEQPSEAVLCAAEADNPLRGAVLSATTTSL